MNMTDLQDKVAHEFLQQGGALTAEDVLPWIDETFEAICWAIMNLERKKVLKKANFLKGGMEAFEYNLQPRTTVT
jgi:hypothetical protein